MYPMFVQICVAGVYEMCDLSPIVFVGKIKYICYHIFVCSGYKNNILKYFTTHLCM